MKRITTRGENRTTGGRVAPRALARR